MRLARAGNSLMGIILILLASCGGGGGGNAGPSPPVPAPAQGALLLTISGLPAGAAAQVRVTGPAGYSQAIPASQTISALTPGTYTVTGERVAAGAVSYSPAPASQAVAIAAGATGAASVSYAAAALKLALREVASVPGASASCKAARCWPPLFSTSAIACQPRAKAACCRLHFTPSTQATAICSCITPIWPTIS